jgi:hypothetical protein
VLLVALLCCITKMEAAKKKKKGACVPWTSLATKLPPPPDSAVVTSVHSIHSATPPLRLALSGHADAAFHNFLSRFVYSIPVFLERFFLGLVLDYLSFCFS